MDERERQIRELINNPGFPSGRITEQQVSNAMAGDMRDGSLDRAAAEEMRRKIADQLFMEMRLRGEGKYNGLRAASPGGPEDTSYAKADSVAAQGLSLQRGSVQRELDRRAAAPAAYDPGRADFREVERLGLPAGKDDYDARVQEIADELFTSGKMEGHPIKYEDAMSVARDRHNRYLKELRDTPAGPVGDEEKIFSERMQVNFPDGTRYEESPQYDVMSDTRMSPRKRVAPPPPPPGSMDFSSMSRPVSGAASPKTPPRDTSARPPEDVEAAARDAAMRALAERRARLRGNK